MLSGFSACYFGIVSLLNIKIIFSQQGKKNKTSWAIHLTGSAYTTLTATSASACLLSGRVLPFTTGPEFSSTSAS